MKHTLKMLPFALILAAGLTACDKGTTSTSSSYKHPSDAVRQSDGTYRYSDGSIHNADGSVLAPAPSRDVTKDKPTKPDAMDQSNDKADLDVTAAIRKAVQAREGISTGTKSTLVIVTQKGTITLKGPVADEAEKTTIGEIATSNAGGRTVDNQLAVTPPK
jgi:hypothetical protein